MIRMRHISGFAAAAALVVSSASCGDVVRDGKSPMVLIVDSMLGIKGSATTGGIATTPLFSDVEAFPVISPLPCSETNFCRFTFSDIGQVTLRIVSKDVTNLIAPTSNNDVTISRVHVVYKRADGRNTPGVDVPYAFDGAATGTIQAGSPKTLTFELVRNVAKKEAPLIGLTNSPAIITMIADVTFYGRDLVGNEISVTGSIQIDFGDFGG